MKNNTENKSENLNEEKPVANEIENKEEETNKVSGGFIGKDWGGEYSDAFEKLAIGHKKHLFRKDEYFYKGENIDKEEAYGRVSKWHRQKGKK